MKRFRIILFWMHLVSGLVAGISIVIMCFTGAVLAFQTEITTWAERDARQITPPATDVPRLSLDDLIKKVREAEPDTKPSAIVVSSDPQNTVAFTLGREGALYANPYTGEIRRPASTKISDLLHTLEDWHREPGARWLRECASRVAEVRGRARRAQFPLWSAANCRGRLRLRRLNLFELAVSE